MGAALLSETRMCNPRPTQSLVLQNTLCPRVSGEILSACFALRLCPAAAVTTLLEDEGDARRVARAARTVRESPQARAQE